MRSSDTGDTVQESRRIENTMPPRIPSRSQIQSQMRAAQRKAESQFKADVRRAEQKLQREVDAHNRKEKARVERELKTWERETNRKLRAARPRVTYTVQEQRYLSSVQEHAAVQAERRPDLRDVFLCHAWDDREGDAKSLHDHLEAFGIDVWFSEKDVVLGTSLLREIDRGLKTSRIGVVLVTPAMLKSLAGQGIADKELSALLATDRVIPVVHRTSYDSLRDESPLLASRSGLDTHGTTLEAVAVKIANAVRPEQM